MQEAGQATIDMLDIVRSIDGEIDQFKLPVHLTAHNLDVAHHPTLHRRSVANRIRDGPAREINGRIGAMSGGWSVGVFHR